MRLPLEWIREFVDLPESERELAERLDLTGTAVEAIHREAPGLENVVVGRVLFVREHPNADRLTYNEVDVGTHIAHIVCGAPNVRPGLVVPVALPGAVLPGGMTVEARQVRGLVSEGMMCAQDELGLGEDHTGVIELDGRFTPGAPLAEALGLGQPVIELDITPNRPDCLSILGLAREIGAMFERTVRYPQIGGPPVEGRAASELVSVEIEDPDDCPRYVALVIDGLSIVPSPPWMQERLRAMGARPINNVVDITNYVMFELGQPLHAFDCDKVKDGHIIVRRARQGERLTTLDGVERELTPDMLLIADPGGPIALAGVMGGAATEVGPKTARVLLESANFERRRIMRASRGLGLLSEASSRFEKGVDPNGALRAAVRAAMLMGELGGGTVLAGAVDVYPKRIDPRPLRLRPSRVRAVLGMDVGEKRMSDILQWLGCEVKLSSGRSSGTTLAVTVPTFRPDLTREIDLIEEVARLVGYSEVPSTLPTGGAKVGRLTRPQRLERRLREVLRAAGVNEAISMGFVEGAEIESLKWPMPAGEAVRLKNPVSAEQDLLRPTLIIELLRAVRLNQSVGEREIALFELGRVWPGGWEEGVPAEETRVGVIMSGAWLGRTWHTSAPPFDLYDLKGVLEDVGEGLWLTGFSMSEADHPSFVTGQTLTLHCGGRKAGVAGMLHPDAVAAFDVDGPVFAAELDLKALVQASTEARDYRHPPRFPAVERDLAVVVDESLHAGDLVATALQAGAPLLAEASVFDVYRGPTIPEGKKSVALGLFYRALDRTLTDREVDEIQAAVREALAETHGAVQR